MYRTIIVPIDLSQEEKGRHIASMALKLGGSDASIIFANIIEELPGYVAIEMPADITEKAHEFALTRLQLIADETGIPAQIVVRHGHPGNEILDLAEEMKADLIMVASHRPGLQDYFIGSTAGRIVRHANCSVLVVR